MSFQYLYFLAREVNAFHPGNYDRNNLTLTTSTYDMIIVRDKACYIDKIFYYPEELTERRLTLKKDMLR